MFLFNPTLLDIIDILIVAYIIYQMLLVVEQTKSSTILIGLGTIYITFFAANWFQLNGLIWLINMFKTVWIVAFIILFQPELRRGLLNLGKHSLIGSFLKNTKNISDELIDELIKCLENLSKKNIGALIILETGNELIDIEGSGKVIDAKVSAELIEAIFTPYGPLHDGAIIIRNNKIHSANCMLPISSAKIKPGKIIGTRHRAALGITEISDSIALVVSEETGAISICYDATLYSNIKIDQIKDKLNSFLIRKNIFETRIKFNKGGIESK